MTDDDVKRLEAAGYEVVSHVSRPMPDGQTHDGRRYGDLIVRRRPPEPEPSECERMFKDVHASAPWPAHESMPYTVEEFRAALAREIAAAEQRGYDRGWAEGYDGGRAAAEAAERAP